MFPQTPPCVAKWVLYLGREGRHSARTPHAPSAVYAGVTRRFRSCHHHMADGNFHSVSPLVKWEGSPTLVSTSPPPPLLCPLQLSACTDTLGKRPLLLLLLFFLLLLLLPSIYRANPLLFIYLYLNPAIRWFPVTSNNVRWLLASVLDERTGKCPNRCCCYCFCEKSCV